jgi:hypothetical protein
MFFFFFLIQSAHNLANMAGRRASSERFSAIYARGGASASATPGAPSQRQSARKLGGVSIAPQEPTMFAVAKLSGIRGVVVDNVLGLHLPLFQVSAYERQPCKVSSIPY